MSTKTTDQDKLNPGARDYQDDFERDFGNRPVLDEGIASPEGAADQAKARLSQGEANVEPPRGNTDNRPVLQRETAPAGAGTPPAAPPTTGQQNPMPGGGSPLRRRRGIIGIVITIVLLIAGLAGFGVLLPFKVPGLVDSAVDEAGQRVQEATERRATLILARAILADIGSGDGVVVTGKGPVSSLIATMKTNKFEADLAKRGLVIEPTDGGVRLRVHDKLLAQGQVFKNAEALNDAIYADEISYKMVKQIVREEIPAWRWMKRSQIAKFIKLKYGVKRFGIKNSENTDPDKAVQEMQKARLTEAYERTAVDTQDAINCIMGDECELKDGEKNISDSNAGDVAKDIDEAAKEVAETAGKTLRGQMQSLVGLLQKNIITKIGTKAIPIVGWIDLVATLDHIAYNALNDDYFSKIPAFFRERAYAQTYADWQGYGDQIKPGEMNGYMVGVLSDQASGAETSCAYNYIETGEPKGVCMTEDQKINENNVSAIKATWEKFKNIPGTPVNTTSHAILNVYYETIGGGGLLGWLGNKIGGILAAGFGFVTPDAVEEWLTKAVLSVFSKILDILGTMVIDVMDNGPKLFNGIHAGATAVYNEYCETIGCRKLTPAQTGYINQQIAVQREQDLADKGWMYATFSPEVRTSVTNQLAIAMPSSLAPNNLNVGQGLSQLASLVSQSPSRMFGLLTPNTSADRAYVDLYGKDPYGATTSDLGAPLAKESMTGEECPTVAKDEYDGCKMDKAVASAMLCNFTPDASECNFANSDAAGTETPSDEPPSSTGFGWPVAAANWPSRAQPIAECGLLYSDGTVHTGIDISVPTGTPILAAADGVITMSNGSFGALNIQTGIKDGAGKTIYLNYQHMSRRDVSVGTTVKRGQVIGLSGKVGTGSPHLHFGVWTTNDFLSGHDSPSSAAGKASLADMKHPMDYLPTDNRNISECKPPYAVPS